MSSNLSVVQILKELEAQIEHHQRQQAFHAEQEVFHRETARHAADLALVKERYESFKASAAGASELVERRQSAQRPAVPEVVTGPGGRVRVSDLAAALIAAKPVDETFGPVALTAELNQRYRTALRQPIDVRTISATLRRFHANGRLRLARPGRGKVEALYTRRA